MNGEAPAVPPLPPLDNISRERLWYAHATGQDPASWPSGSVSGEVAGARSWPDSGQEVAARLPDTCRRAGGTPLPPGTVHRLESLAYPHGRATDGGPARERLGHALLAAFGLQRREPSNPFNDHRGYPSVRSAFPVQAFVQDGGRWRVLDVYRRALLDLETPDVDPAARVVTLAGRYTRLPTGYGWYRNSLLALELGINLRALCVALELFGLTSRLRLPDETAAAHLAELGLTPTREWTLPLSVELSPPAQHPKWTYLEPAPDGTDAALDEVVVANRSHTFEPGTEPVGAAIPVGVSDPALSWSELLWRRTGGGMPQGQPGMNGYRRQVRADAIRDAARWQALPPPGSVLGAVSQALRTTVVVQATDSHADGIYRVLDGRLHLETADPMAAARLEAEYGYSLQSWRGCDVRHASALWFYSVRPADLVAQFGISAWAAAQYACGWAAHGVCLAAAAHDLYARPVRAFEEAPTQRILGLPDDEMVLMAIIVGTPRSRPPVLDLRL